MNHYTYKITNISPLDSRIYYIGVRSCECNPEDDLRYMGSSKSLKKHILLLGVECFKKEVLSIFNSRSEAVAEEIRLHNLYDVSNNIQYYNLVKQTSTSFDTSGFCGIKNPFYGKRHSIETRKRWSNIRKGTNLGIKNPFYGKKHSAETKEKIAKNGWEGISGENRRNNISNKSKDYNSIQIFDSNDILQYEIFNSFQLNCKSLGLPYEAFRKSFGKPIYKGRRKPDIFTEFVGWYALKTYL